MKTKSAIAKGIQAIHKGQVYIIGGTLLPHASRDLDLLLLYHHIDYKDIEQMWERNYSAMGFDKCTVYTSYEAEDDSVEAIVTLHVSGLKVDLLYASLISADGLNVVEYMRKFFPLSVQEIAMSVRSGRVHGEPDIHNITYKHSAHKAMEKYQKYYPNAVFTPEITSTPFTSTF